MLVSAPTSRCRVLARRACRVGSRVAHTRHSKLVVNLRRYAGSATSMRAPLVLSPTRIAPPRCSKRRLTK